MKNFFTLACFLLSFLPVSAGNLFDFLNNAEKNPSSPLLIIFYREDCGYCVKMNTALQQEENFTKQLKQHFNIQRIDIGSDAGRALANSFNIHSVPTIVNIDLVTGVQQTIKGFPGINKLAALLNMDYTSSPQKNMFVNNSATAVCGDGIIDAGEQCDDGNVFAGDGCNGSCNIEPGFICTGSPSACTTVCGDGIIAGVEQCDDANSVSSDGCNSSCAVEPGYICSGSPSVCVLNTPSNDECSNAIVLSSLFGTIGGNNTNATNSGVAAPTCQPSWQKDMWYSFTITGSRPVTVAVNGISMSYPIVSIYSGSCGALVPVGCNDDSGPGFFSIYTGTLAAGTYYIRVSGYSSPAGIGTFTLVYNFNASCGNNITEAGEECDDGNINSGDGCSYVCAFENATGAKGVAINEDGVRPNPSSMLDVKSDSKGVLIPRLTTTQRTAIASPPKGLIVFDITSNSFWYYKTNSWSEISSSFGTGFSAYNGSNQSFSGQFLSTFPVEQYDDGNNFSTNVFTAPQAGVYQLSSYATFTFTSTVALSTITLSIENTSTFTEYSSNSIIVPAGFSGTIRLNTSMSTKLNAAATVGVRILVGGTPGTQQLSSITYSGFRVY